MDIDARIDAVTLQLSQLGQDQATVSSDLKDVLGEKASLEYLLKDRLEKMVQQEIDDRINAYKRVYFL